MISLKILYAFLLTFLFNCKLKQIDNFVSIAIIGTNDIHGNAFPIELQRSDNKQSYKYGGLQYMASMIQTIKQQHKGNFLYFDAGDQFQGGIQSSPLVSSGQIMNDFFNEIKVDSSAIGNHQFDFGSNFLLYYLLNRKGSSNLAANLKSSQGEQQFLPEHKNIKLFTLQSGIKIGVIGLTTLQTLSTTNAFHNKAFPLYQFHDYVEIIKKQSKILRQQRANAIILVGHLGNRCNADSTFGWWYQSTMQPSECKKNDQISKIIDSLPSGTIDAVVQGHRHTFSHHFVNGIPIMSTINGGAYFNILYLQFYNNQIVQKFIQGPIPVCQKVFSNLRKCDYQTKQALKTAGDLVEWQFHGKKVKSHPRIEKLFQIKWIPKMKEFMQPLVLNEVYLRSQFDCESKMGNLITDLIDMSFPQNDFIIINEGGFRTTWFPGTIQFQHFYNMFPFTDSLVSFQITGQELLKTLSIVQTGKKAFYPTKKLKQAIRIYSNSSKQFVYATFSDDSPIQLSSIYRGISLDFLINGGDQFRNVVHKVAQFKNIKELGDYRDTIKFQLQKLGTIKQNKLIDLENPRILINKI